MKIKAIIFDMDGVIFDSEQVYYDSFYISAKKNNVEAKPEFVKSFAGKSSLVCSKMLKEFFSNDLEKIEKFQQDWNNARYNIIMEKGLGFKPGFLILIRKIKQSGLKIGLVTSASYSDMISNFQRNDNTILDYFMNIVTIEDVENPKPNPEPYVLSMNNLGVKPTETIVIEDSYSGIQSALKAKANTIMISFDSVISEEINQKLLFKANTHNDILIFLQEKGVI